MSTARRDGRPYRRLVAELKAQRHPCWLCGHAIDYDLPGRHVMAFTLDHVAPLSLGGDLLDPANARAAHRRCNSSRGNRLSMKRKDNSRRW